MVGGIPVTRTFDPNKPNPFVSNKFKRRCPIAYFYMPIECSLARSCNNGFCPLSHTKLEVIFHPILHKTKRCSMALMNVCNFSQRCAFHHNDIDRVASHLSWLVWQRNWGMHDNNIASVLAKHNLGKEYVEKVCMMISFRSNFQTPLENFPNDDYLSYLEGQLSTLIDSCETTELESDPNAKFSLDKAVSNDLALPVRR